MLPIKQKKNKNGLSCYASSLIFYLMDTVLNIIVCIGNNKYKNEQIPMNLINVKKSRIPTNNSFKFYLSNYEFNCNKLLFKHDCVFKTTKINFI